MSRSIRLRDVGDTFGGLTGKTKTDFGRGSASFVTFLEVVNNTRLKGQRLERVRVRKGERQNRVLHDDLLFNGSSETPEEVALCSVVDFHPANDTYLNSFCFGYRLRPGAQVHPAYLAYLFRSGAGRQLVSSLAQGATRYNIAKTKFVNVDLGLPSPERQREIVDALTDIDDLIDTLECLVTKKQAMKQGMMQQLLTGRTRLPGFTEEWRPRALGEMLSYERPGRYLVQTTKQLAAGRIPVLTAGKTFILGYTNEPEGVHTNNPVIIFDDFTTASKYVDFDFKAKSSAMKILSPKSSVELRFVYERMQLIDFPLGDHKRYWISEYSKQEIDVPDFPEQRVISAIITDAYNEISILRRRLTKAHAIKTGMTQELLTRLPVDVAS